MNEWIEKNRRLIAVIAAAAAVTSGFLLYFFNPMGTWWMPRCWWLMLTGTQCPSCGAMRAAHQLMHGHVAEAAALNWWLPLSIPMGAAIIILAMQPRLSSRAEEWLRWLLVAYVVSYIAWWVVRNLLGI